MSLPPDVAAEVRHALDAARLARAGANAALKRVPVARQALDPDDIPARSTLLHAEDLAAEAWRASQLLVENLSEVLRG